MWGLGPMKEAATRIPLLIQYGHFVEVSQATLKWGTAAFHKLVEIPRKQLEWFMQSLWEIMNGTNNMSYYLLVQGQAYPE